MGSFGETLRQARLDKSVSLSEAERDTRIRRRYLEALENEDYSVLPAPVYTRGIIRNYARYLGLGPEAMVDLFTAGRNRDERVLIRPATGLSSVPTQLPLKAIAGVMGVILAVVLILLAWDQYTSIAESIERVDQRQAASANSPAPNTPVATGERSEVVLAAPTPTPSPTLMPTPTATPVPIRGVQVDARLVADTWMEVWTDDQKVLAETLAAGETRRFTADRSIRMRVANGSAVEVEVNGAAVGALDPDVRAVEARWTRG